MAQLLDRLRRDGSVMIDLPSISESPHAQAVASLLDAVVLGVACGRTTIDDLAKAIRALESADAKLVGMILNRPFARSNV